MPTVTVIETACVGASVALGVAVGSAAAVCVNCTATVCAALAELSEQGLVCHDNRGYQLKLHFDDPLVSLSRPIDPPGKGNGKH